LITLKVVLSEVAFAAGCGGTAADDYIKGTSGSETIHGRRDGDAILGLGGNDGLRGGTQEAEGHDLVAVGG